jgi:hypothetical protein
MDDAWTKTLEQMADEMQKSLEQIEGGASSPKPTVKFGVTDANWLLHNPKNMKRWIGELREIAAKRRKA